MGVGGLGSDHNSDFVVHTTPNYHFLHRPLDNMTISSNNKKGSSIDEGFHFLTSHIYESYLRVCTHSYIHKSDILKEKHEVAKLIGSPPGYVGHDDGGQLTKEWHLYGQSNFICKYLNDSIENTKIRCIIYENYFHFAGT